MFGYNYRSVLVASKPFLARCGATSSALVRRKFLLPTRPSSHPATSAPFATFAMRQRVPFASPSIPLSTVGAPLDASVCGGASDKDLARLPSEATVVVPAQRSCGGATVGPTVNSSVKSFEHLHDLFNLCSKLIQTSDFSGEVGALASTTGAAAGGCKRLVVVGVGDGGFEGSSYLEGCRLAKGDGNMLGTWTAFHAGKVVGAAHSAVSGTLLFVVPQDIFLPNAARAYVEGVIVGLSPDYRYKVATKPRTAPTKVVFAGIRQEEFAVAKNNAVGALLARDLVNTPPNVCHPESLAAFAKSLANECKLEVEVFDGAECEKRKMGAYLAVHQGSNFEPQFIHLTYKNGTPSKRIVLIGKGLCMDTGGYNIKSAATGIDSMKADMGGAAAVLASAQIISLRQPENVEVHFVVAAAENMISSTAYRPGDIVTASNGKTISIGNTDAEGRLTLADALVFAEKELKPDVIVDIATLTGAQVIALGPEIAAAYSNCGITRDNLLSAACRTGEPLWPLPLFAGYNRLNKNSMADLNNAGSVDREAGSIGAALFLQQFVDKTAWAHIDCAGPAYNSEAALGTGYGARLLADFVSTLAERA